MIGALVTNVVLELSPSDAALFIEFRKRQAVFQTLIEQGVFGVRNGKAILNFNNDSVLTKISYDYTGWERGK